MNTLEINIVSSEKSLFSGQASFVSATGVAGELGFYPGHAPLLTLLAPGQVRILNLDGKEEVFWVSGGIMEVQAQQIIVLADAAERADDLDEALALAAKAEAEAKLSERGDKLDTSKALSELSEITSQLNTIERLKKISKR